VSQTGDHRDADQQALLGLLPPDGSPADSTEIRSRLGWVANGQGFCLEVDARSQDVTITVSGPVGNA
jgi:hypothetical protein